VPASCLEGLPPCPAILAPSVLGTCPSLHLFPPAKPTPWRRPSTVSSSLGALAVLLPILDHLGLREIINRQCAPVGESSNDLDPGLVTPLLVANRLLAPKPLVHVETWLAKTGCCDSP